MTYTSISLATGGDFVLVPRADFERLVAAAGEDARDLRAAELAAADPVRYPAPVLDAMLAGTSPVAAWRTYRRRTQAGLAAAAGISQTAIARLETRRHGKFGYGRPETRKAIAAALDVPLEALDPLDE